MSDATIIYTKTDEAPALATYSLLPIVQAFTAAGVNVATRDISLAGRIIASFPESLSDEQQQSDALAELGELATTPAANIIKLPNISASIPQLTAAIAELQAHGYAVPDYPAEPSNDDEAAIQARYAKILGSAVNPVLREGNSDRRVAAPVKAYAQKNPHRMGAGLPTANRTSRTWPTAISSAANKAIPWQLTMLRIELVTADGTTVLKEGLAVFAGEVIDSSRMSAAALRTFLDQQVADAKAQDVLYSLHMKATMMKVSDPIIFGHAVRSYYADVFAEFGDDLEALAANPNNGIGDIEGRLGNCPRSKPPSKRQLPPNNHRWRWLIVIVASPICTCPSDIIIDASMPAAIRGGGKCGVRTAKQKDTKFVIPDNCYAGVYEATIKFFKANGAFDVSTMGNVSNVGLMAKKAEEYGSHDKTFEAPSADGHAWSIALTTVLVLHAVEAGDIGACAKPKTSLFVTGCKLAVNRARATGAKTIFWLNEERAHDASLIAKINAYLPIHEAAGKS